MFSVRAYLIDRIRSYHDAESFFESSKLTNRNYPDMRYLVRKGDESKTIHKIARPDDTFSYSIKYHRAWLVTYHANGSVTIEPGQDSKSDREIFDRILPPDISCFAHRGCTGFGINGGYRFVPRMTFTLLRKDDQWVFDNVPPMQEYFKYSVDRKISAKVRNMMRDLAAVQKLGKIEVPPATNAGIRKAAEEYAWGAIPVTAAARQLRPNEELYEELVLALNGVKREAYEPGVLPPGRNRWEGYKWRIDLHSKD